jgi:hypothetical protein
LIGSLLVSYVFFLAREPGLARRSDIGRSGAGTPAARLSRTLHIDMGALPPVPWILATVVLFAPLAMLAYFSLNVALVLIGLAILLPILFARFDR